MSSYHSINLKSPLRTAPCDWASQRIDDLATGNPAKVAELKTLLHDWRGRVNAQMPTLNPDYAPAQGRQGIER